MSTVVVKGLKVQYTISSAFNGFIQNRFLPHSARVMVFTDNNTHGAETRADFLKLLRKLLGGFLTLGKSS